MSFRWRVESSLFVLPKGGAGVEECEDAAAASEEALAFAVADGATEAFDARRWARRLAEGWVREAPAAAAWFFEARGRGQARLAEFDSLAAASENERLAEFVRRERREGLMKDDDVAVLRIQVVCA